MDAKTRKIRAQKINRVGYFLVLTDSGYHINTNSMSFSRSKNQFLILGTQFMQKHQLPVATEVKISAIKKSLKSYSNPPKNI